MIEEYELEPMVWRLTYQFPDCEEGSTTGGDVNISAVELLISRMIDWLEGSDSDAMVERFDKRTAPADAECMCDRFLVTESGGRFSASLDDQALLADKD
jgi:hypothetical protein